MNSNLDVWAIQSDKDEMYTALDQIKEDGDVIIYTNLVCEFTVGNEQVKSREFDTIVISDKNDFLAMFMRKGPAAKQDICGYLDSKGIRYTEITFAPSICDFNDDNLIMPIWMAREEYVLEDALKDSIESGDIDFDYYPELPSNLELDYLTNENRSRYSVEGRLFTGALISSNKIILLVSQGTDDNLTPQETISILENYGINYAIRKNDEFTLDKLRYKNRNLQ